MDEDFCSDISTTVAHGFAELAQAITPLSALTGTDATGGTVGSLTEAVMGVTAGLVQIADAISDLAEAVRERDA